MDVVCSMITNQAVDLSHITAPLVKDACAALTFMRVAWYTVEKIAVRQH